MALRLQNLDEETRQIMLSEIDADIASGSLYVSPRLSARGAAEYPNLMKTAAHGGTDTTLALALARPGVLNEFEPRRTKNGVSQVKVPVTAHETLSEGEFNRFYIRALCARAIEAGRAEVTVYRAKEVMNARAESVAKIGARVSAQQLLDDLRANPGVDTALGLPAGPNSGLSVHL